MPGVANPRPHQTYRHPRVVAERRPLGDLAADFIRVEMKYAGVCGTDLHCVQEDPETGYIRTSAPMSLPAGGRVIGHEGIGRIIGVGAGVQHLRVGAMVAFEAIMVCHRCEPCRQGHFNQCGNSRLLGMELDGLFATVADVPASVAHDVTAWMQSEKDARSLACLEPAGVALVACQNGRLKAAERVVILGTGPIGIFCAMLGRLAFGAGPIHVVEPSPFRRAFAARWADQVHTPEEFFAEPPSAIDVAIEASGALANVDRVLPLMSASGRIVVLGRSGDPMVLTATDQLITNSITITGSRGHLAGAFGTLLRLIRDGRFVPQEIVTLSVDGVGGLAALLRAPDQVAQRHCKVLVKF